MVRPQLKFIERKLIRLQTRGRFSQKATPTELEAIMNTIVGIRNYLEGKIVKIDYESSEQRRHIMRHANELWKKYS